MEMDARKPLLISLFVATYLAIPLWTSGQDQAKVEPVAVVKSSLDGPASFTKDVLPILEDKCQGCHSSVLAEGKLMLEEHAQITKGGKRGPAIVPGKSADSLLIKAAGRTAQPYMPPPAKKEHKP